MRRTLPLVLIVLFLLARPAWRRGRRAAVRRHRSGPVAKLLLSDDEDERARGAALLHARMQRGDDVADVARGAGARAGSVGQRGRATRRTLDRRRAARGAGASRAGPAASRRHGSGRHAASVAGRRRTCRPCSRRGQARRGRGERMSPPAGSGAVRGTAGRPTPPPPAQPPAQVADPGGRSARWGASTPRCSRFRERRSSPASPPTAASTARAADDSQPLGTSRPSSYRAGRRRLRERCRLPEARVRPVDPSQGFLVPGRELVLVQGDAVRYRSRARRTKGAWAVDIDTLPTRVCRSACDSGPETTRTRW